MVQGRVMHGQLRRNVQRLAPGDVGSAKESPSFSALSSGIPTTSQLIHLSQTLTLCRTLHTRQTRNTKRDDSSSSVK